MAVDLPHPLISTVLQMDYVTIGGATVAFKHVFFSWVSMGLLFTAGFILRGRISMVPGKLQNFFEVLVGGLENIAVNILGEDARRVFPLLCGIFIYVLVQNLLGLVPGCDAPTANINTNAAMALFVFLYYNYQGVKRWGPRYIGHFTGPMKALIPLMLPLELISHLARPLSLTLRLFGNILGGVVMMTLIGQALPVLVPMIPAIYFDLFDGLIQAVIFVFLTSLYISEAVKVHE
jgi:F-type H+-transporting ATPase subunit a